LFVLVVEVVAQDQLAVAYMVLAQVVVLVTSITIL
jgi:hypothetical protein